MPAFDGTGPLGQGPRTGRGLGYCPPGPPRYVNPPRFWGGRLGLGWRRGWGRGWGRGFGWRWRAFGSPFHGWALPYEGYYEEDYGEMNPEDEIAYLKDQAGALQKDLEAINKRIDELTKRKASE